MDTILPPFQSEPLLFLIPVDPSDDVDAASPLREGTIFDGVYHQLMHGQSEVSAVSAFRRTEGLITLRGGTLTIPDWEALQAASEFDPTYLHLKA